MDSLSDKLVIAPTLTQHRRTQVIVRGLGTILNVFNVARFGRDFERGIGFDSEFHSIRVCIRSLKRTARMGIDDQIINDEDGVLSTELMVLSAPQPMTLEKVVQR